MSDKSEDEAYVAVANGEMNTDHDVVYAIFKDACEKLREHGLPPSKLIDVCGLVSYLVAANPGISRTAFVEEVERASRLCRPILGEFI